MRISASLAPDIVHCFKIINYILINHSKMTIREISQELYIPESLVGRIYLELQISCRDKNILNGRTQEVVKRVTRKKIKNDPYDVDFNSYQPVEITWERPAAVYTNTSPYGIADDLHRNPENYGTVGEVVKNKFGKLNKKHLTSTW